MGETASGRSHERIEAEKNNSGSVCVCVELNLGRVHALHVILIVRNPIRVLVAGD